MTLKIADPKDFGFVVAGPLLAHFFRWLDEQLEAERPRAVFFLAREGYFLRDLYCQWRGDTPSPPLEYLLCSRQVALAATEPSLDDLASSLGKFSGPFHKLLHPRFGLDDKTIQSHWGAEAERVVDAETDVAWVAASLRQHWEIIVANSKQRRQGLLTYLDSVGFNGPGRVALVDLGYSATQQRALHRITGQTMSGYYFATTPTVNEWRAADNAVHACFRETSPHDGLAPVHTYSLLMEAWLTAPVGQVRWFSADGSPDYAPPGPPQQQWPDILRIADGAAEYLRQVHWCRSQPRCPEAAVQGIITALADGTVTIVGNAGDVLQVEDNFCSNGVINVLGHYKFKPRMPDKFKPHMPGRDLRALYNRPGMTMVRTMVRTLHLQRLAWWVARRVFGFN